MVITTAKRTGRVSTLFTFSTDILFHQKSWPRPDRNVRTMVMGSVHLL